MSDASRPPSLAMVFVVALSCSAMAGYLSWHFSKTPTQRIVILDDQRVLDALNNHPERMDETLQQLNRRLRQLKDEGVIVLDAKVVKTPDMVEVMP